MEFTITGFPVPPSVNALYRFGHGKVHKSKSYKEYERSVYAWINANQAQVKGVREFLKDISPYVLDVSAMFYMPRTEIVCLDGRPKRNDTSNRLKALHDALSAAILGIDDCYFWSGGFNKCPADEPSVEIIFKLRMIDETATA